MSGLHPHHDIQPLPLTSQPHTFDAGLYHPLQKGQQLRPELIKEDCPVGLELLASTNDLLVHQHIEYLEIYSGQEGNNRYIIKNPVGQPLYYAIEQNDYCTRNWLGTNRPFTIKIFDNTMRDVAHISRPYRCPDCHSCCWCCYCCVLCQCLCCFGLQYVKVFSPPGQYVGSVEQGWSMLRPNFKVKDAAHAKKHSIRGPWFLTDYFCCGCCPDINFQLLADDGSKVGRITKQWTGAAVEKKTDVDMYLLEFPQSIDVRMKLCVLAATLLIDFMFFESRPKKFDASQKAEMLQSKRFSPTGPIPAVKH